ncbi:TonB-dependent receptor plug domain-containing protein [Bacterioplanoides sp.]|uniref:TonB-dependent receptor plug domain-containing protein n=1 Tax=Bacterioplanoides sp. TaxID=2066072 RepID=UPI003B58BC92
MTSKNSYSSLALLALGVTLTPTSHADPAKMDTIIVEGQSSNKNKLIEAEDIEKNQLTDLAELFGQQSDIAVGGGFGFAQKVYVRGIEDTNLNVSIDGASQSGQIFQHQGRVAVDPELLKKVEVQSGSGNALSGFGALGGAIRYTTKDAEDFLHADEKAGAQIKSSYSSNNNGNKTSAAAYGLIGSDWSALATLSAVNTSDLKDGNKDKIANTDVEQLNSLIKLKGKLSNNQSLAISFEQRQDDGYRNQRPHFINAPWNPAVKQKSKRNTTTLAYGFNPDSPFIQLQANTYITENKNTTDFGGIIKADIKTTGLDIRNTSIIGEHKLTYGAQFQQDKARNKTAGASDKGDIQGMYIQDQYRLMQDLTLDFGGRFDRYQLKDTNGQKLTSDGFSPNLGLIYQINDQFSFKPGYSQALRGQKIRQAVSIGQDVNDKNLKAEKAENTDLTLEYSDSGLFSSISLFETRIKDVVSLQGPPGPGTKVYRNGGTLKSKGVSLVIAKSWDNTQLSANYNHTEVELGGEPLNDSHFGIGTSSGDKLSINLSQHIPAYQLELGWNSEFVNDLKKTPMGYPKKPGYSTHNAYIQWLAYQQRLSLNLSIHNIFDRQHYDHATYGFDPDSGQEIGLPEPGRDVRLAAAFKF